MKKRGGQVGKVRGRGGRGWPRETTTETRRGRRRWRRLRKKNAERRDAALWRAGRVYRLPARSLESEARAGAKRKRTRCVERESDRILFLSGCEQILRPSSGRQSCRGIPDFPLFSKKRYPRAALRVASDSGISPKIPARILERRRNFHAKTPKTGPIGRRLNTAEG